MKTRKEFKDYVKSKLATKLITTQRQEKAFGIYKNDIHINAHINGGMSITLVEHLDECVRTYILNVMGDGSISWRVNIAFAPCWEYIIGLSKIRQAQYEPICLKLSWPQEEYPDKFGELVVDTVLKSYKFYHSKYKRYTLKDVEYNGKSQQNN